jgi:hypothetical protein
VAEVQQLQTVLDRIPLEKSYPSIAEGSLAITSQGNYFIAISAGKLELDGKLYYLVSLASPIGGALSGHSGGATVPFRGGQVSILEVI